ncbi:MAG TPA: MFS transporter [Amycolatopsis sp.]|nr:MFS transporter [Amycolatopsis sp.]
MANRWWRIGVTMLLGLFVAYLDRSNLSIGLPSMAKDLGFSGARFSVTSSLVLTVFNIGYAVANVFGGLAPRRLDPKITLVIMVALWSVSVVLTGFVTSVALLLVYRIVLGVAEGAYWPQQSRIAHTWFRPEELTKANSIIQYHGQFLSLALGFAILTPLYDALGWPPLFFITGGIGLVVIVPLFLVALRTPKPGTAAAEPAGVPERREGEPRPKLTLASLGGPKFLLVVFSYLTNGMIFWGATLWMPLVVSSLGFHGLMQGFGSGLPYLAAVVLAIPMAMLSDRTGRRTTIAALGLIVAGVLLVILPEVGGPVAKLILIICAIGFYASSFSPNIWAIIQSTVDPRAIGPAAGIVNGIGAGLGGVLAGWLVGLLHARSDSYLPGFVAIGAIAVLGGLSLVVYGRLASSAARTGAGSRGGLPARAG